MWEEGGDENWRGDCVASKRRDLKVIKHFKTSERGVFFVVVVVTAVFFFLADVQGNSYRLRNILAI